MAEKGNYRCALLEEGELDLFFEAKRVSYTDPDNEEVASKKDKILAAMEKAGPAYFAHIFNQDGAAAFIVLDGCNTIVGSAEIVCDNFCREAEFQSGHIRSDLRGRGLSELLYQAREIYARQQNCNKLVLTARFENAASQGAALHNGFRGAGFQADGGKIFRKRLLMPAPNISPVPS